MRDDSMPTWHCVYTLEDARGRIFYVGMTKLRPAQRLGLHRSDAKRGCRCPRCCAVRDRGPITITVVYRTTDRNDAYDREAELITLFGQNRLCNSTNGKGLRGYTYSTEMRQRMGGPRKRVVFTCERCGTDFERLPSQVGKGCGHFCSRACQCLARRSRIQNVCLMCTTPFTVRSSKANQQCCSRSCAGLLRRGRPKQHSPLPSVTHRPARDLAG